jgi:uncharacterized repeat protein (TIGR01451 family)
VTSIDVAAVGAAGNGGLPGGTGGSGAKVTTTIPTAAGTTLYVEVGSKPSDLPGGVDGGGSGGFAPASGGCGSSSSTGTDTSVSTDTTDPAEVVISWLTPADLAITNSASPSPVISGNRLTYTLIASNSGGHAATGVSVSDVLPANAHFNSITAPQGTTCTRTPGGPPKPKDGAVKCDVGTLAGDSSVTITIVVTATTPRAMTNTASVTATNVTADADDTQATTTTVIGT